MNRRRQKIDALAAMAAANPASAAELAAEIGEAGVERALADSIDRGRAPSTPIPAGDSAALHARGTARWRWVPVALGAAAATVLAALLLATGWLGGSGGGRPEFAAAAIRVAKANPRLLVTSPGWKVVRADQFQPDEGEVTFGDGEHRLDMRWYPAQAYGMYLRDRAQVSPVARGALLGQRSTTVEYAQGEYATMLAPQGSVFVEVRARLGTRAAYEEVLQSLRQVDVETWLEAMPPSVVRPAARSALVERMLRGTSVPPGFDPSALEDENSISRRSTLGVAVANEVACGWVESWIRARRDGNAAAARAAVEAMASSSHWPVVRQTKSPWFGNYRIVVRQLRAGHLDRGPAGYEESGGELIARGPSWKFTLGCGGTWRRRYTG
jgi:hypothetical protein